MPEPGGNAYGSRVHEAALGPLEHAIAQTWSELLGRIQVGRRDHFFELGGHSLLAVKAADRIARRIGQAVPVSLLYRNPQLQSLAEALSAGMGASSGGLVPLNHRPGTPTLFLLHPVGGDVWCYQDLADSPTMDLALAGLARAGAEPGGRMRYQGIVTMAHHHAERIIEHQPQGPYCLAGWSMGGLIAMEVAAVLTQRGHRVAFLGLIDSALQERFVGECDFASARRWLRAQPGSGRLRRTLALNALACHDYRPGQRGLRAHYYLAAELSDDHDGPRRLAQCFEAPLELRSFAASHDTIVRRPVADALAGTLSRDVHRALNAISS